MEFYAASSAMRLHEAAENFALALRGQYFSMYGGEILKCIIINLANSIKK